MQTGILFSQVNEALSFFVNQYAKIATYKASIERLAKLQNALDHGIDGAAPKNIHYRHSQNSEVNINNLTVLTPDNTREIIRGLSLRIPRGQSTLIKADNGFGKSTLLKAIGGAVRFGEGDISIPSNMLFFSQAVFIPQDTLRSVLAYPNEEPDHFRNEEYVNALSRVGLEQFSPDLDSQHIDWNRRLSGGERQKIAFARALLQKPEWLIFDETTAALTDENETRMYGAIRSELPDTTIISVGHRPNLRLFHEKVIKLIKSPNGATLVSDEPEERNDNIINARLKRSSSASMLCKTH